MASYAENYVFATTDQPFRTSVAGALIKLALDVNGEARGEMTETVWRLRAQLAQQILQGVDRFITPFAVAAKQADYTLVGEAGQDGYLYNTLAACFNDIAFPQAGT